MLYLRQSVQFWPVGIKAENTLFVVNVNVKSVCAIPPPPHHQKIKKKKSALSSNFVDKEVQTLCDSLFGFSYVKFTFPASQALTG